MPENYYKKYKKRCSLIKHQGDPHSALPLIRGWKSTIYNFITKTIRFRNVKHIFYF